MHAESVIFSSSSICYCIVWCLCERLQTNGSMHSMQTWLRAVEHTRKEKRINVLMLFVRWVLFRFFFVPPSSALCFVFIQFNFFFALFSTCVHLLRAFIHIVKRDCTRNKNAASYCVQNRKRMDEKKLKHLYFPHLKYYQCTMKSAKWEEKKKGE